MTSPNRAPVPASPSSARSARVIAAAFSASAVATCRAWPGDAVALVTPGLRDAEDQLLEAVPGEVGTAEERLLIRGHTDEVSVEKGDNVTDVWVFRRLGERDECLSEHVKPRVRNTVSLMLWGCFAGCFRGPLVPLHGQQTAETYIQVLQEYLVPFIMETLPENGVFDAIFQQDNAPTHKAHITRNYLQHQGFVVMNFPRVHQT